MAGYVVNSSVMFVCCGHGYLLRRLVTDIIKGVASGHPVKFLARRFNSG